MIRAPAILVVGTGSIARRHIRLLFALGCEKIAVCSEFRRHSSFSVGGVALACGHDFEQALLGPESIVLLANPSSLHADYSLRALRAGKHVLVEKPASLNVAQANEMIRVARATERTIGVVHQFRFHPLLSSLRCHLKNETIGNVVTVEARQGEHLADYHPGEDYRQGYAAREDLGGGILLTQVHLLDLLCHILGPITAVVAAAPQHRLLDLEVEEAVSFLAHAQLGRLVYGHLDFHTRPRRFVIDVIGDSGSINWDYYASTLTVVNAKGEIIEKSETPFDRDVMFRDLLIDYLGAIENGRVPAASLQDSCAALALVDAVKASISTGSLVSVARNWEWS